MAKFIVKGKVKYQGKLYNSGEVVEVEDKHVEEFKKHGWECVGCTPVGQPQGEPEGDGEPNGQGKKEVEVEALTEEQIKALFEQKPELAELTNAQLEALLEEKGVEFKKGAKKAILLALLA